MIKVAVRDEDEIRGDFAELDLGRFRVGGDEGIEEQVMSAHFNPEAGVPVVGQFHGEENRSMGGFHRKTNREMAESCRP